MKNKLLLAVGILTLGLVGCGQESETTEFNIVKEQADKEQQTEGINPKEGQGKREDRVPGELPEGVTEEMIAEREALKGSGELPEGMTEEMLEQKEQRKENGPLDKSERQATKTQENNSTSNE